jgi:hypothetical protein
MIVNGVHINDKGMPIDSFDLKQAIMEAWHVVDDLKLLMQRLEYMNEDQIASAIHGLEIFADMRCESLWNTFENCISNGVFDGNNRRTTEITETLDEIAESFGQEKL